MDEVVDTLKRRPHGLGVAHVPLDPFGLGTEVVGPAVVHLRVERVEHAHLVPLLE